MGKIKRVDLVFDLSVRGNVGNDGGRKKKEPSMPPRTDAELERVIDEVYSRNRILSYCLLMQSLTGLRYSDCSQLMYRDFYRNGKFVDSFDVIQQKTFSSRVTKRIKKIERDTGAKVSDEDFKRVVRKSAGDSTVKIFINDSIKDLVELCRGDGIDSEYLFANTNPKSNGAPMDIRNAEYHLRNTEQALGLNYQLRTHSFRKCFSLKLVREKVSILMVRDLLGHSNVATTNAYLSTIDGELADVIRDLKY